MGAGSVTANTQRGLRASMPVAKGARVAVQNGRFQFVGRWLRGPFAVNLSKTGMSASIRNRHGSLNVLKPMKSSFSVAGIQVRGMLAFVLNTTFLALSLVFVLLRVTVIVAFWLLLLPVALLRDIAQFVLRRGS